MDRIDPNRPLHVSPEVEAGAKSARTEADAAFEIEFGRWLRNQPQLRRFIAEYRDPSFARLALRLTYLSGRAAGYREGVETVTGFDPASGPDGLLRYIENILRPGAAI